VWSMPQKDVLECSGVERKMKRTIIDISRYQTELDFDEAELSQPFTFPEYQRGLISDRLLADLTDMGFVAAIYSVFIVLTYLQMPDGVSIDRRVAGIYAAGFLVLVAVYYLLFMLSASQTPGMKLRQLVAVSREGDTLEPQTACMRGFGYFISIVPLMLGFVWAAIDPEHLTWADKVSGTYLKKI
jgi:uncharacterized RDD family membrane protein YckC